jgi:hypothetical protein
LDLPVTVNIIMILLEEDSQIPTHGRARAKEAKDRKTRHEVLAQSMYEMGIFSEPRRKRKHKHRHKGAEPHTEEDDTDECVLS